MNEQYPTWDDIAKIHALYEERSDIEMVLSIFEYGEVVFFNNYLIYLEETFGKRPYIDLVWDEVLRLYTTQPLCQLWVGLDSIPAKRHRQSKYDWFDRLRDGQIEIKQDPPKKRPRDLSSIFN